VHAELPRESQDSESGAQESYEAEHVPTKPRQPAKQKPQQAHAQCSSQKRSDQLLEIQQDSTLAERSRGKHDQPQSQETGDAVQRDRLQNRKQTTFWVLLGMPRCTQPVAQYSTRQQLIDQNRQRILASRLEPGQLQAYGPSKMRIARAQHQQLQQVDREC